MVLLQPVSVGPWRLVGCSRGPEVEMRQLGSPRQAASLLSGW